MSKTNKAQEEAQEKALAQEAVQPEALKTLKPTAGADELAAPRTDSPLERGEVKPQSAEATKTESVAETETHSELEGLADLADRHRIASWQQVALMRHMGWDEGKKVSNADYNNALDALKNRRMGGGRKE